MATSVFSALRSTPDRARWLYSPVLVLLSALFLGPLLGGLVALPFWRAEVGPTSSIAAASFNHILLRSTLALGVAASVGIVTWLASRLEGSVQVGLRSHLRQCSLVYVYLLLHVGAAIRDALSGGFWECFVCPLPWEWIALPAILANALTMFAMSRSRVAA
jgi:cytochrome bd-type quinol oxidase subunit 2